MVKRTVPRPRVKFTGGGRGLAVHAGARLLADLADRVGLTAELCEAMAGVKVRDRGHGRGRVLADAAVMIADGGERVCDVAALAGQPRLFGAVASTSTLWRTLEAAGGRVGEIKAARAAARARAWAAGADPGFYVVDVDATLVESHSDKQAAAGTYKGGFGFGPLMAYLDATGECLAGVGRAGNAGSNTATDHIKVLDDALAQLPVDPHHTEVTARADTAGCSKAFLQACRGRGVKFCVGHRLSIDIAQIIAEVPDKCWQPAASADGTELLDHADVAETTHLVDLSHWPEHCRMIARREHPRPGAQLNFCDADGRRLQVLLTDIADNPANSTDIAYIEALHRGRGRAERQISDHKNTGLAKLLRILRHQLCVAATVDDRARPARLDPPARPRRRPRQSRTQTPPPLPAAHRRPAHPNRPTTHRQTLRRLAPDPPPNQRVPTRPQPPPAHLNTVPGGEPDTPAHTPIGPTHIRPHAGPHTPPHARQPAAPTHNTNTTPQTAHTRLTEKSGLDTTLSQSSFNGFAPRS